MKTLSPRVIKAAAQAGQEASSYNLIDLRHRFDRYADDVRAKCKRMVEEAEAEVAAIRERAQKEGHKEGLQTGLHDAAREIEDRSNAQAAEKITLALSNVTPAVQKAAAALDEQRFQWLARWETAAVDMAIELTKKLTGRMLERDATIVRDRALMALQVAAGSAEGLLHMNPQDVEDLGEAAESMTMGTTYEVVADKRIARGDCLLSSPDGEVDSRLSVQIDRIVEELLGESPNGSSATHGTGRELD